MFFHDVEYKEKKKYERSDGEVFCKRWISYLKYINILWTFLKQLGEI